MAAVRFPIITHDTRESGSKIGNKSSISVSKVDATMFRFCRGGWSLEQLRALTLGVEGPGFWGVQSDHSACVDLERMFHRMQDSGARRPLFRALQSLYMNQYLLSTTLTGCVRCDTVVTRKCSGNGAAEASEESPERRAEADHPVLVAPECSCPPDSSLSDACDPVTGQCPCRAHFHGLSCQLCSKGYWQPALSGQCQPCNCDPTRSYGDTCDQVGPLLSLSAPASRAYFSSSIR